MIECRVGYFRVTTPEPVFIGPDEKRRALERVLSSHTFSRSDQLKRFLRYICEKEIAGKIREVNEYSIGTEALGKRPGYSPGDDSSVRTRAHVLRQKLQEFYDTEEPDAEVRIEVPRGSYTPRFLPHSLPSQNRKLSLASVLLPETPPSASSSGAWPFAAGCLLASLVFSVIFFWIFVQKDRGGIDPVVREAWGDLLKAGERVDVCVATPPSMLLHSFRERTLPAHPFYLPAPGEVASWYQGLHMMDDGGNLYMHTTQDVLLLGDSLAAISAVRLLTTAGVAARVVSENDLRPYALRDRNVILIGSPNYSPYAARVLGTAAFSVRYDPISREEVISDNPSPTGTRTVFKPDRDQFGQRSTAYGLLTVFPSQGGDGNAETVICSGISAAGPQSAMEFFKSAPDLRFLKKRFASEGHKRFPRAYQVVVRCALDHNLALNWTYVTHRVLPRSPL